MCFIVITFEAWKKVIINHNVHLNIFSKNIRMEMVELSAETYECVNIGHNINRRWLAVLFPVVDPAGV